jgi:hypothetical protein
MRHHYGMIGQLACRNLAWRPRVDNMDIMAAKGHCYGEVMNGALATSASPIPRVQKRSVNYAHAADESGLSMAIDDPILI